ncbi:hypothetical protein J6590_036038 [Homalodisca vitripennis]|nr:hypothetical protein J6590_036038 [Homalodisca vitripennis]
MVLDIFCTGYPPIVCLWPINIAWDRAILLVVMAAGSSSRKGTRRRRGRRLGRRLPECYTYRNDPVYRKHNHRNYTTDIIIELGCKVVAENGNNSVCPSIASSIRPVLVPIP